MGERHEETFVRELFASRYRAHLRKLPESSVKTPDFELLAPTGRAAVLEVKLLERAARTEANGWRRDLNVGGLTRTDNSPARVAARIHDACKQFAGYSEPKILVFVNEEHMDVLDLQEAFDGFLDYGTDEAGHMRNVASSRRAAVQRIREERWNIDLFIWLDHRWGGCEKPVFRFVTDAGYDIARLFFGVPESPRPDTAKT